MGGAQHAWLVVVRRGRAGQDEAPFENGDWDREDEAPDPDEGTVILRELTGERFVIGRSMTCHLQLRDSKLQRNHLALEPNDGTWEAVDFTSVAGTYLNGARIARAPLGESDVLAFGTTTLRLFTGPDAAARAHVAAADAHKACADAERAYRERPSVSTRAENALREAVSKELERAKEQRRPLALLNVAGPQGTQLLTLCTSMLYRLDALGFGRCEHDVTVLLHANANDAAREAERLRPVVAVMAKKYAKPPAGFSMGIAVFDGRSETYRSDVASALIAAARAARR